MQPQKTPCGPETYRESGRAIYLGCEHGEMDLSVAPSCEIVRTTVGDIMIIHDEQIIARLVVRWW